MFLKSSLHSTLLHFLQIFLQDSTHFCRVDPYICKHSQNNKIHFIMEAIEMSNEVLATRLYLKDLIINSYFTWRNYIYLTSAIISRVWKLTEPILSHQSVKHVRILKKMQHSQVDEGSTQQDRIEPLHFFTQYFYQIAKTQHCPPSVVTFRFSFLMRLGLRLVKLDSPRYQHLTSYNILIYECL